MSPPLAFERIEMRYIFGVAHITVEKSYLRIQHQRNEICNNMFCSNNASVDVNRISAKRFK